MPSDWKFKPANQIRKLRKLKALRNSPSSNGVSWGLESREGSVLEDALFISELNPRAELFAYPNITAFQIIILFSDGAPLTPAGGSSWSLKEKRKRNIETQT